MFRTRCPRKLGAGTCNVSLGLSGAVCVCMRFLLFWWFGSGWRHLTVKKSPPRHFNISYSCISILLGLFVEKVSILLLKYMIVSAQILSSEIIRLNNCVSTFYRFQLCSCLYTTNSCFTIYWFVSDHFPFCTARIAVEYPKIGTKGDMKKQYTFTTKQSKF